VRSDLTPGQTLAQSTHAAIEFVMNHLDKAKNWHYNSNTICILAAKDEEHLKILHQKATELDIASSIFREPDLENSITAIAMLGENSKKILSNLPLALKQPNKKD
jgi:peptidyl-tRNA hydrolase